MGQDAKIKSLSELVEVVDVLRRSGSKIVHSHGAYDVLHVGHLRHFERARETGDVLVVTVTPDHPSERGQANFQFSQDLRVEALASLTAVDFVAIATEPTAVAALLLLHPDVYAKGSEFRSDSSEMANRESAAAREIGAKIVFTDEMVFNSSYAINRHLSHLADEIRQYVDIFGRRWSKDAVLSVIDKMLDLRVLVIGDTIIDDYQYCSPIGMSSKDPALALRYQSHDLFAGGVLAVANHVANFARHVSLATVLGEKDSHEDLIRSHLNHNVVPHLIFKPDAPTTVKRRFVDDYSFSKLLEVYVIDDSGLPAGLDRELEGWLEDALPEHDVVIAADFGHGAISRSIVNVLVRRSKFLAVNTQANALNRGLHTITRYPRVDYACIAEHEARLEMRDSRGAIRPMIDALGTKLDAKYFVITQGRNGCAVWGDRSGFAEVPSFAQKVVDRVGAGDAFLSVTALAAAQDVPIDCLGFIGNVVGALAVEILGNQKAIDSLSVKKLVNSLLEGSSKHVLDPV